MTTFDWNNNNLEIASRSHQHENAARARHAQLTKPPGALGRLEELGIWLAGVYSTEQPRIRGKAVVVCAADHGVAAEGISAYPASVTPMMLHNMQQGGAAINAIAKTVDAELMLVNAGINADLPTHNATKNLDLGRGSANLLHQAALTKNQATHAIQAGLEIAHGLHARGINVIGLGELGIGNTTSASAISAKILNAPVQHVLGRGTGLDDAGLARKAQVLQHALARVAPIHNPFEVLCELGGLEIAVLVGLILGAAQTRSAIVLDGVITGAAALVATGLTNNTKEFLIASDLTAEPAHALQLQHLGLTPLFDFALRLGEGTGAALAMPMLEASANVLSQMATFAEAGVPQE